MIVHDAGSPPVRRKVPSFGAAIFGQPSFALLVGRRRALSA